MYLDRDRAPVCKSRIVRAAESFMEVQKAS